MRVKLGRLLLKAGVMLAFNTDKDRDSLKRAINNQTYLGAYAETGGHLLEDVDPICDYATQSVINVLRHNLWTGHETSKRKTECIETW